ncbi:MAG TPA: hypothetical protein VK447_20070, partial [Myxococcaceae bacterium]|nr:hypothetical protein [Myxococcaceae bacterium]
KDYVMRSSRLSREERAQVDAQRKALKEKDEAAARAAAAPKVEEDTAPREVIIRVGLGEEDPVDITDTDDYDAPPAEELSGGEGAPAVTEEAPAEPAKKGKSKRSR